MFITFEGIDGCGKSTQIKMLSDYLKSLNFDVVTLREPGGTPSNERIRSILLETKEHLSPVSELLLFEAARNNLVNAVIKPALKSGKIVLSDRFYDSTTAYQGYGRGLDIDLIKRMNNLAVESTHPHITFFLNIKIEDAAKRGLYKTKDRIEISGNEFFEKVRLGYQKIAEENPDRIITVDSSNEIDITHNLIKQHIQKKINKSLINKSTELS